MRGVKGEPVAIGAVSVSGEAEMSFVLPEHRDGVVAARAARRLEDALHVNVAVICGIHVDDITQKEIADTLDLCDRLTDKIIDTFSEPKSSEPHEPQN